MDVSIHRSEGEEEDGMEGMIKVELVTRTTIASDLSTETSSWHGVTASGPNVWPSKRWTPSGESWTRAFDRLAEYTAKAQEVANRAVMLVENKERERGSYKAEVNDLLADICSYLQRIRPFESRLFSSDTGRSICAMKTGKENERQVGSTINRPEKGKGKRAADESSHDEEEQKVKLLFAFLGARPLLQSMAQLFSLADFTSNAEETSHPDNPLVDLRTLRDVGLAFASLFQFLEEVKLKDESDKSEANANLIVTSLDLLRARKAYHQEAKGSREETEPWEDDRHLPLTKAPFFRFTSSRRQPDKDWQSEEGLFEVWLRLQSLKKLSPHKTYWDDSMLSVPQHWFVRRDLGVYATAWRLISAFSPFLRRYFEHEGSEAWRKVMREVLGHLITGVENREKGLSWILEVHHDLYYISEEEEEEASKEESLRQMLPLCPCVELTLDKMLRPSPTSLDQNAMPLEFYLHHLRTWGTSSLLSPAGGAIFFSRLVDLCKDLLLKLHPQCGPSKLVRGTIETERRETMRYGSTLLAFRLGPRVLSSGKDLLDHVYQPETPSTCAELTARLSTPSSPTTETKTDKTLSQQITRLVKQTDRLRVVQTKTQELVHAAVGATAANLATFTAPSGGSSPRLQDRSHSTPAFPSVGVEDKHELLQFLWGLVAEVATIHERLLSLVSHRCFLVDSLQSFPSASPNALVGQVSDTCSSLPVIHNLVHPILEGREERQLLADLFSRHLDLFKDEEPSDDWNLCSQRNLTRILARASVPYSPVLEEPLLDALYRSAGTQTTEPVTDIDEDGVGKPERGWSLVSFLHYIAVGKNAWRMRHLLERKDFVAHLVQQLQPMLEYVQRRDSHWFDGFYPRSNQLVLSACLSLVHHPLFTSQMAKEPEAMSSLSSFIGNGLLQRRAVFYDIAGLDGAAWEVDARSALTLVFKLCQHGASFPPEFLGEVLHDTLPMMTRQVLEAVLELLWSLKAVGSSNVLLALYATLSNEYNPSIDITHDSSSKPRLKLLHWLKAAALKFCGQQLGLILGLAGHIGQESGEESMDEGTISEEVETAGNKEEIDDSEEDEEDVWTFLEDEIPLVGYTPPKSERERIDALLKRVRKEEDWHQAVTSSKAAQAMLYLHAVGISGISPMHAYVLVSTFRCGETDPAPQRALRSCAGAGQALATKRIRGGDPPSRSSESPVGLDGETLLAAQTQTLKLIKELSTSPLTYYDRSNWVRYYVLPSGEGEEKALKITENGAFQGAQRLPSLRYHDFNNGQILATRSSCPNPSKIVSLLSEKPLCCEENSESLYYLECVILKVQTSEGDQEERRWSVSLGFAEKDHPEDIHFGSSAPCEGIFTYRYRRRANRFSIGYSRDAGIRASLWGRIFPNNEGASNESLKSLTFSVGDVIGAGYDPVSRSTFFTRNGQIIYPTKEVLDGSGVSSEQARRVRLAYPQALHAGVSIEGPVDVLIRHQVGELQDKEMECKLLGLRQELENKESQRQCQPYILKFRGQNMGQMHFSRHLYEEKLIVSNRARILWADNIVPRALVGKLNREMDAVLASHGPGLRELFIDQERANHVETSGRDTNAYTVVDPFRYPYIDGLSYPRDFAEAHELWRASESLRWKKPHSPYQLLPSMFWVSDKGETEIRSDIVSLPKELYGGMYGAISQAFSLLLPLFERCCGFSLRQRELQVIVRAAEHSATSGEEIPEEEWKREGAPHEDILAVGVCFYRVDPSLTTGGLAFRQVEPVEEHLELSPQGEEEEQDEDEKLCVDLLFPYYEGDGFVGSQQVGLVPVHEGNLVVFNNNVQHRMLSLSFLPDDCQEESAVVLRSISFLLVCPQHRIISTREIPNQPFEISSFLIMRTLEEVAAPLHLSVELLLRIMSFLPSPISLKEALRHNRYLHFERWCFSEEENYYASLTVNEWQEVQAVLLSEWVRDRNG